MSKCNCKVGTENSKESILENKTNTKNGFINYFLRSIGFLISLILLPLINIVLIKFLFEVIVLSKKVDLKEIIQYYFKNNKVAEIEEDDDYLELNEEDVEMLNVEEIL